MILFEIPFGDLRALRAHSNGISIFAPICLTPSPPPLKTEALVLFAVMSNSIIKLYRLYGCVWNIVIIKYAHQIIFPSGSGKIGEFRTILPQQTSKHTAHVLTHSHTHTSKRIQTYERIRKLVEPIHPTCQLKYYDTVWWLCNFLRCETDAFHLNQIFIAFARLFMWRKRHQRRFFRAKSLQF